MNISNELFEEILKNINTDGKIMLVRKKYGINYLLHDESPFVRKEIAKAGFYLNELKNDKSWLVRLEVARQGYALEELANDPVKDVRGTAIIKLKRMNGEKLK